MPMKAPTAGSADPRLISIARIQPELGWRLEDETHVHHELIAVAHGRIHVRISDQELTAGPGDILFYRAGLLHTEWNDTRNPFVTYGYAFQHATLPEDLALLTPDREGRIRTLSDWLAREFTRPWNALTPIAASLFQTVLTEWRRLQLQPEANLVTQAREHMRHHLSRPLSLEQLAGAQKLSRFHFLRRYRALSGRTPMQDLTGLRMEHARHLLLSTNLPLKAIAPLCGLATEQHLCRLFRQHMGVTPGETRRHRG